MPTKKKTIEETYQKLSQREHVLRRSGMYIGETKLTNAEVWVFDVATSKMVKRPVEYSPGFLKIFDEVLTNATDHATRDDTVNTIKVEFDKTTGVISVYNNGRGVPVVEHREHKMFVPELIFGHLLAGSNYDDTDERTGSGTNGIGIKCLAQSTMVPLFNGEMKSASELQIGDYLIGDDGTPRKVLTKQEGYGDMYKVVQYYGEDYIVNENHILTLHMPDHKVIFWNNNGWSTLWWNNDKKCIETKFIKVFDKNWECQECGMILNSNIKRHNTRQHPKKSIPKFCRKFPSHPDISNSVVASKLAEMQNFIKTIPYDSVFDISIQDFMKLNKTTQRRMAGVRGDCVQWPEKQVMLDPYVLGLWLGDGMKHGRGYACNGKNDQEIIEYLWDWCSENDAILKKSNCTNYLYNFHSVTNFGKKNSSPLRNILKMYNVIDNKHIPRDYLINSRDTRLKVLAGLIDTDGIVFRNGTRVCITQSHRHERLANDIVFLARSLGFYCTMRSFMAKSPLKNGEQLESLAYRINISGKIEDIPTKLPRKCCSNTKKKNTSKSTGYIRISKVNPNKFIGLGIDGNQRFVINDFTVTHNCVNIFSKEFTIETIDSEAGLKFVQHYHDNMERRDKPKITKNSSKSYTKVTFLPDYPKFGMNELDEDTISILSKRVYDCIACTSPKVSIYLNGEKLKGKGLQDYVKYFFDSETSEGECKVFYENATQLVKNTELTWEYAIVPWNQFEHVSFVNGNSTYQGGKHVDNVMYQITNKLQAMLTTKKKLKDVKPAIIREKMFLFLRATVINPHFNSQTKEFLTTQVKDFGCKVEVSDKFIGRLWKSSIIDDIVDLCKAKENMELARTTDGKKKNRIFIPKLEDALWAGTAKSDLCTLVLTEGDSAKTFAMWGRSIVGAERMGAFPLKGKVLNIRDATVQQLMNNEEINNLKQIIGLKQGKEYTNTSDLRYGKVLLLTDADLDGSHIKSLIVNFFHAQWPSLLKLDFLQFLRTPIIKAIKGSKVIEFFNEQDYNKWKETVNTNGYHIRYFKGLGTSKKTDAQETFKNINNLKVDYYYKDSKCDESILLAFDKDKNIKKPKASDTTSTSESQIDQTIKSCTDKRKLWLSNYDKNAYIDAKAKRIPYQDLINKELIHFSIYDNTRSIPNLCDGLKPSQRKILYYMLSKNITKTIKVAQLSGYVSAETGYHHGENSLQQAIIGMAQNFTGSNNINLLYPDGNFGCLDPDTEIILWDGGVRKAKDICVGDALIGDNGTRRTVLAITSGEDMMYNIKVGHASYKVNSKHILTLKFTDNKKIQWKDSNQTWIVRYYDNKSKTIKSKSMSTCSSSTKESYNKSKYTKEEAFYEMRKFIDTVDSPDDGIIDIKVEDFLKLSKYDQKSFMSIWNQHCIQWDEKQLPIDPYIFGSWLGDGNSDGSGITSIDHEILQEWVRYLDSIQCELVHDVGSNGHDNYHFTIRNKGFGFKSAVGDSIHNAQSCAGCTSKEMASICDWKFDKNECIDWSQCVRKIRQVDSNDNNTYTITLRNGQTYNVCQTLMLTFQFNGHKKISFKPGYKLWSVEYFDGNKIHYITDQDRDNLVKHIGEVPDNNVFTINLKNYLNFNKTTQSKLVSTTDKQHQWKQLLTSNNLLNKKYIPDEYIHNSRDKRLQLLAGVVDTDGTVKYNKQKNGYTVPYIVITQSTRLRHHVIESLDLLCKSLGFKTSISYQRTTDVTSIGESKNISVLCISGDDLHTIPMRVERKRIKEYKKYICSNYEAFQVEYAGRGQFNGWQLDGNERFLLNNFIVTHNSRLAGGKDAASARYIYTHLSNITTYIFDSDDTPLLNVQYDDGQQIEPEWFIPILPMVLVNGCEGIGTGYSTYIPPHNPKDIIANILRVMDDKQPLPMKPYFRNFDGEVVQTGEGTYTTKGRWERVSEGTLRVTELPIGTSVTQYKEFLEGMIEGGTKKEQANKTKRQQTIVLKDVRNKTSDEDNGICFDIDFKDSSTLQKLIDNDTLEKEFKLVKAFNTNNMYLFDDTSIPSKYKNTTDILLDYYDIRIEFYEKRKEYLLKKYKRELSVLQAKVRFIYEYISGELEINRKSKDHVLALLEERGFPKHTDATEDTSKKSYDYLVRMPVISLTKEKIEELEKQTRDKQSQIKDLSSKTEVQMWKDDLSKLEKYL